MDKYSKHIEHLKKHPEKTIAEFVRGEGIFGWFPRASIYESRVCPVFVKQGADYASKAITRAIRLDPRIPDAVPRGYVFTVKQMNAFAKYQRWADRFAKKGEKK